MSTGRHVGYPADPVHRLIERQAQLRPDTPAVVAGPVALTFGELNSRANQLAHHLRAKGIGLDDRVGTCLRRSPDAVVSVLGIVKSGAAPVLLDPAAPAERLKAQLADSGVTVVVTSVASAGVDDNVLQDVRTVLLDGDRETLEALPGNDLPDVGVTPESAAHVVYTSGSTGTPKGVVARHETVSHCMGLAQDAFGITDADRGTWVSAPAFGVSLVNELWPLLAIGAAIHIPDDETLLVAERFQEWLLRNEITVTQLVGSLAAPLCALPWPAGRGPRLLLTTGERLQPVPAADLPFDVVVTYGSTETTHITTQLDVTSGLSPNGRGEATVGWPVPNTSVHLLDEAGEPVESGEVGQIHVAGPGLARGYLGDPALTAAQFQPDPFTTSPGARMYRTGDLGRLAEDGALTIVGRVDRQVKIRGTRVNLDEVEAVVVRHAGEAAVVAVGDEPKIIAYLAGIDGSEAGQLHRVLSAELTRAQLPGEFVLLDNLPRTASGKLDRAALPAPRAAEPAQTPSDSQLPFAAELTEVWRELLERKDIGPDDGFFELGGHSLLAVQMVVAVQARLGVRVDLAAFYDRPTISALAGLVAAADQPESLFVRPRNRPDARVRLVCFPYAGGGVTSYANWIDVLPDDVDLVCVQPPGRGARLSENPLWWLDELVIGVGQRLIGDPHQETVLFGHSLGAIVAFEVARWLRRNGYPSPARLIVAGSIAPQLPITARVHEYPDDELLAHVGAMGGTPAELLDDQRLRPVLLPALRADFAMHETYHYRPEEPLDCPITAFAGLRDPDAPAGDVTPWRDQTIGEFRTEVLPGGHFFITEQRDRLLATIIEELTDTPAEVRA